jgi:hypothetical protein
MNWKGSGRKLLCPYLRYNPGDGVEGLRITTKIINQDCGCPDRDSISATPECKSVEEA